MTDSPVSIYLLRHGECEGGNIFRGHNDVPLTSKGFEQMRRGLSRVTLPVDEVWASPLKRCSDFARQVCSEWSCQITIDNQLKEMSFGDWEGEEIDRVWQTDTDRISQWSRNPVVIRPPGGESIEELALRVDAVIKKIETYTKQNVLIVSHGGWIRVVMCRLLGMPLEGANRFDVPYGCLSKFSLSKWDVGPKYQLKFHSAVL